MVCGNVVLTCHFNIFLSCFRFSLFLNCLQTMKQGGFPNTQSTQHVPSTSIPSGLPLPQQLPVHPYSQPTLPLGPFASLVGYPYMPQNYFLPSAAFQQAYSSNGPFHQSAAPAVPAAGMKYSIPQYKSSPPASSLPQPSSLSGYGGFGNANNIPGNFSLNQGAPSAPTTMGFDEALGTQFKDPNNYAALQQVMEILHAIDPPVSLAGCVALFYCMNFSHFTLLHQFRFGGSFHSELCIFISE